MDACRPPIEAIRFYQEEIMCFQSLDYVAFNENLRKRVPTNVLVDRISELNDELVVQYKGPKEEPIPPKVDLGDFFPIKYSPFDYLWIAHQRWQYLDLFLCLCLTRGVKR